MSTQVQNSYALLLASAVLFSGACGAPSTTETLGELSKSQQQSNAPATDGSTAEPAAQGGAAVESSVAEPPANEGSVDEGAAGQQSDPVPDSPDASAEDTSSSGLPEQTPATEAQATPAAQPDVEDNQPCVPTCGDVDGMGGLGAGDIRLMQRHIVGEITLSDCAVRSGDVTGDGQLNTVDVRIIQRVIAGDIDPRQLACAH